jgi:hydroxymethylglutaryl-CoA lyase
VAEYVRITDVSPRDGLQNEPGVISTAEKVRLVELLCATGVDEIEVTSFVSPKWVPQLGDGAEVFKAAAGKGRRSGMPLLSALVPNVKGMEAATALETEIGVPEKVSVFTAASETFSQKNTNASIAETIERFKPVLESARRRGMSVRGYVSCVIACPFEGVIAPRRVAEVVEQLLAIGVDEVDLGDTIGAGTPRNVAAMLREVGGVVGEGWLRWEDDAQGFVTLHLHDTFGRAAECVKAALDLGVRSFDGSVAGLGGCPYASTPGVGGKRAPGNISTETLVRTVHEAGYETGVDLDRLEEAAAYAREMVARSRGLADGGVGGTT